MFFRLLYELGDTVSAFNVFQYITFRTAIPPPDPAPGSVRQAGFLHSSCGFVKARFGRLGNN